MSKSNKDESFRYPEELKPQFTETDDLVFRDGTHVSTEQIWDFMTEEAPRRYPYAFNASGNYVGRLSSDTRFLSGIKRAYLSFSFYDRLTAAKNKGIPIVYNQGGQTWEPYFAAGGIGTHPVYLMQWALNKKEGLNYREAGERQNNIREESRKKLSIEICNDACYGAIQRREIAVDLIAPYLCLRCSDVAYGVEAHRHGEVKTPLFLVDFPVDQQKDKEWAVDYFRQTLIRLVEKVSSLSGKETTEEDLTNEIKLHNQVRELTRNYVHSWWDAKTPPTNSVDHSNIISLGNEMYGDPVATKQIAAESLKETKERIKHSVKGVGLQDDPARIFVCGSCVSPNTYFVDKVGGVVVGKDDQWSEISTHVSETGDPYENLARAILSFPYELSTEERGLWTAEQAKKSRADGVVFMYQWGCNYQTAVARMINDVVKDETGIPTVNIELAELGRMEALEQSQNRVETFIEMLK